MSMSNDPLSPPLERGLQQLGLALPAADRQRLLDYVRLLVKWNAAYNLTAVRDPQEMVTRHLLDSLVLLPHLRGTRVLDIGTGAGLPGIPLAVARPELSFTLIDANAKKTRFVTQAVGELGLKNVEVVQTRVENYRPAQKFDTLVSRAFAGIADMLTHARHLCAPHGRILAMKGVHPQAELTALPAGYDVEVVALTVPGLEAARHVAILTPRP
jgi:16S rRNA (guanine527-N7)-methyltransferase